MLLERIVGRDVAKVISSPHFNNVHYLRQMLYCVFQALHKAQRKLAFHHADLRLPNIMELFPSAKKDCQPDVAPPAAGSIQAALLYDSQHVSGFLSHVSDLQPDSAASGHDTTRSQPSHRLIASTSFAVAHAASALDSTSASSSASVPIPRSASESVSSILAGPSPYMRDLAGLKTSALRAAHFKIIDFGLADFRETFGAGYVTAKRDSLIHSRPHRQPSLQSSIAKQEGAAFGSQQQQQEQSNLLSNSKIEWHTGSTPRKLARKRSSRIPAVLLPEVTLVLYHILLSSSSAFDLRCSLWLPCVMPRMMH